MRRLFLGAAGLLLLIVAVVAAFNARGPGRAVLAERCAQARPAWENYQEDIKGQVGAGPAAQWEGEFLGAYYEDNSILVVFELAGPWADHDFGIPVLLRDPYGKLHRHDVLIRHRGKHVYRFELPGDQDPAAMPWVEIQYPHHRRKAVLREAG